MTPNGRREIRDVVHRSGATESWMASAFILKRFVTLRQAVSTGLPLHLAQSTDAKLRDRRFITVIARVATNETGAKNIG
jgi:hypothetical protein